MTYFCLWCFHSLPWLSFHPAARTLKGQTQVFQLWSEWGFMWQFSQGWVAEKKTNYSHIPILTISSQSILLDFCSSFPVLNSGSLPSALPIQPLPELTAMRFTPRPWLGLCCDWAPLRITDQKCPYYIDTCCHHPPIRHWHLLPPFVNLPHPLGIGTCIFQPPNMPLFFQIRVSPWSPQVSINENPAALPSLPLPTCPV